MLFCFLKNVARYLNLKLRRKRSAGRVDVFKSKSFSNKLVISKKPLNIPTFFNHKLT